MNGTSAVNPNICQWCGGTHATLCPMVKAIEYFETGIIKRVEFKTAGDYGAPIPLGGQHYIPEYGPRFTQGMSENGIG